MKLSLVSYNIHSGVGNDKIQSYHRIGQFLASLQPDFVCLQEVDFRDPGVNKEAAIQSLKANYFPYFTASPAVKTESGFYGNAMLSRYQPTEVLVEDISVQNAQPRNIQHIKFHLNQQRLAILNTHFGLTSVERNYQFKCLGEQVSQTLNQTEDNVIVAGDFNEWRPFWPTIRRMNTFLNLATTSATFPNTCPLFKLDRVWLSAQLHLISADVIKTSASRRYSDHYPILVEFELNHSAVK